MDPAARFPLVSSEVMGWCLAVHPPSSAVWLVFKPLGAMVKEGTQEQEPAPARGRCPLPSPSPRDPASNEPCWHKLGG